MNLPETITLTKKTIFVEFHHNHGISEEIAYVGDDGSVIFPHPRDGGLSLSLEKGKPWWNTLEEAQGYSKEKRLANIKRAEEALARAVEQKDVIIPLVKSLTIIEQNERK